VVAELKQKIHIASLGRQRPVPAPAPPRKTGTTEKTWAEENPGCLVSIICFVLGGILLANDIGFGGFLIFIGLFAYRFDD
jgi:hypothetical protein